jgi:hypothetical protein
VSTSPRVHTLAAYQAKAKALVGQVKERVTAHALRGDPATGILGDLPIGVCVQLVGVWHAARDAGFTQDDLTARLGEEGRLVFEMVVGMYDTACHAPLPHLLESAAKLRDALA